MSKTKWAKDVGPGWSPIVNEVVGVIEEKGGFIMQVKEKFGGLRIYSHGGDYDAIDTVVKLAEAEAERTCEVCGRPGTIVSIKGWWKTRCVEHSND